jgi:hypothetical protein
MPESKRSIGIVFMSEQARQGALALAMQHPDAVLNFAAPRGLYPEDWDQGLRQQIKEFGRAYLEDGLPHSPVGYLASVDELLVVTDQVAGQGTVTLNVPVELDRLLALAHHYGIPVRLHDAAGHPVGLQVSPPTDASKEFVTQFEAQRIAATQSLDTVRVDREWHASGLWNAQGAMLSFEQADVPMPLARRLVRWISAYNRTLYNTMSEAFWIEHHQMGLAIARDLQAHWGARPRVVVWDGPAEQWVWIGDMPVGSA